MITVLLADDHAVVAEGFATLLKEDFNVVGIVNDGRSLVAASDRLQPDVIITDISMPLLNGLDAVRQIKSNRPHSKVIVLTMHRDPDMAVQAFRAGALGYLVKTSPGEEIITAIREVANGRAFITTLIAKDLISILIEAKDGNTPGASLTQRQREVLQLIAEGRTMKQVAAILHISPRTAESHKYEMMEVLGVDTTAALIQHAIRLKLIAV